TPPRRRARSGGTGDEGGWVGPGRSRGTPRPARPRRYARGKRDAGLERSLEQALEQSSLCLGKLLAADQLPPADVADAVGQQIRLADALACLPEAQRAALTLRYLHDPPCSLAEIARQLGRTQKAAAGLGCPGLETLRKTLREPEEP